MPISSLPDSTLRVITSALVLIDAASVVKELIDNALDAKATTIAIEISANTLDVIQAKDDGTGVGVEDRQLVCKRGCTSKIATIEDLQQLGGSFLGFRGEALASVAELSESVTLTTRVDGETAGSMLRYGPAGTLKSCSSASHPIGSTIRVKDFLKSIPVRKQAALKNASKTLSAIKKLLQTYAFARGTVRFSFKVLKGKSEKANWSYGPVDRADKLRDVATRIVGKDVAARCEIRTKAKPENGDNELEGEECSVVALLATIDDDAAILNNTGHYISIDGRPVTAARGTIKEVVKLYRHYVRNCAVLVKHLPASVDPLLVMHITLPRGSYDVNVEPAKDEVMFMNPKSVLTTIEALFKDHYGEQPEPNTEAISNIKAPDIPKGGSPFDLLLAKRPSASIEFAKHPHQLSPGTPSPQQQHNVHGSNKSLKIERNNSVLLSIDATAVLATPQEDRTVHGVAHRVRSNMYGFDDDEEIPPPSLSLDSHDVDHDIEEVGNDLDINPWSLAKLYAPARRSSKVNQSTHSMHQQLGSLTSPCSGRDRVPSTSQASTHHQPLGLGLQLPSPVTSPHSPHQFQNPGPPRRPWPSRQRGDESAESEFEHDLMSETPNTQAQRVARSLEGWAKPVLPRTELPSFKRASDVYNEDGRFEQAQDEGSSQLPTSRAQSSHVQSSLNIASHTHPQQAGSVGRSSRTPLLRSPANTGGTTGGTSQVAPSVTTGSQQTSLKLLQSQNPELDQIMDFERRKKAANVQQRKGFSKAAGRVMAIAQLAQPQRSTGQASADDLGSTNVPGYQDHAHDLRNQASAVTFGDRFDEPTLGHDASPKPSPYRNRYLAAARSLTRSQPDRFDIEVDDFDSSCLAKTTEDSNEIPRMPEDDTRAYLIRHRSQTENANTSGLSRTLLKIPRTKTLKLPLESIPPNMTLHDVVAQVDSNVQLYTEADLRYDRYSVAGNNDLVKWSSAITDILSWQAELTTQIETMYRARVGGELISPNLELDLRRMIKAHCDSI